MYLKSLELQGFKTFADKTVFEFGEGITAIVGPNGVGKSNIADAVMWVLGEQSTKALRTASARDVIFAGSNGRRPRAMAEVSLTIDNSDGALDIDYSEVTITRRVFRDGNGEYLINKSKCRLRDIYDLFLDTGIGKQAYSIVTQGQIDAILSIRSEDRRELLDEVAGVQKYRVRRRETLRKLEATQANLLRIGDICHELEQQRAPLAEQAETARRYKQLTAELQELELELLVAEHAHHKERLGRLVHEQQVLEADLANARSQVSKLDAEQGKLRERAAEVAAEIEGVREQISRIEAEADRALGQKAVADERLRSLAERRELLARRREATKERLQANAEQEQELTARLEALSQEAESGSVALEEAEAGLARERQALEEKQRLAEDLRNRRMNLAGQAVAARSDKQTLESLEEELRERLDHINERIETVGARRDRLQESLDEGNARLKAAEEALARLERDVAEDQRAYDEALRLATDHEAKRDAIERHVSSLRARLELLRELEHSVSGRSSGVAAVLEAAREGKLHGIRGTVGQFLEVPERYDRAIEAALGESIDWVITDNHDDAVAAVRYLAETRQGSATFFPLISSGAVALPAPATLASSEGDVIGVAARLVKYPKRFRRVFEYLLSDVIVAASLDAALRLSMRHGASLRLVTLTGEALARGGAVTGGSGAEDAQGTWDRKREIEATEQELKSLEPALNRMNRIGEACQEATDSLTQALAERRQAVLDQRSLKAVAQRDTEHLAAQIADASETLTALEKEIEVLTERLEEARREQQARGEEARELSGQADAMAGQVEQAEAEAVTAQEQTEVAAAQVTAASVAVAEADERVRSAQAAVDRCLEARRELEESLASDQAEYEGIDGLEEEAKRQAEAAVAQAEGKRQEADQLREELARRREAAQELQERIEAMGRSGREVSEATEGLRDRVHQAEVSRAREEAQLDNIRERLADAYELTPQQAARKASGQIKRTVVEREVRRLKRDIRAMGEVNVGAVAEYDRLKARLDFLTGQREDLENAKADLEQIIADLDEASSSAFLEAFEAVGREFDKIFKQLFGGGETQLILTDPDDLLQTGVEVIVRVPDKKVQNLLSLSGGERALTATALLFSLLRVRPSPFCVVDEVDAPLDDSNVQRFLLVLRDFAQESQFIVITHNPLTMEGADRLLGVTMAEPGISTRIELQLEEAVAQAKAERERARRGARGATEAAG
ncbi:MAG: chromosome segregation protein SMC [Armatimonadota bacterium]